MTTRLAGEMREMREVNTAHSARMNTLEVSLAELKEENRRLREKAASVGTTGEYSKGKALLQSTFTLPPSRPLSESSLTVSLLARPEAGGTSRGNRSLTSDVIPYVHRKESPPPLPEGLVHDTQKG